MDDAKKLFSHISNAKVCEGNIDTGLPKLTTKEKENMNINESKTSTRLETPELKQFNKVRNTIHNQHCTLLTDNEKRYNECRHNLQRMEKRQSTEAKGKKPRVSSKSKPELLKKRVEAKTEKKKLL